MPRPGQGLPRADPPHELAHTSAGWALVPPVFG